MNPLYFRITEKPDRSVFVPSWIEILDGCYVLDRTVWRRNEVSRSAAGCVVLRADHEFGTWELKNMAVGRVVVLSDADRRYDLVAGMSMALRRGTWRGTLTDAFSFVVTSELPNGTVRGPHHDAADESVEADEAIPDDRTAPRAPIHRMRRYLDAHPTKRMAMAYMWREHLAHTVDLAEDIPSANVGRAFGVSDRKIMRWREDLALHLFEERGHQHVIRDWVIKHQLLSRTDVEQADRYVRDLRRGRA